MPIVLSDLFTVAEIQALHRAAGALAFEAGKATAGRTARAVKDNEQAAQTDAHAAIREKVQATLLAHPLFQTVAYPRRFATTMVTRTRGGGQYGDHIDNALIAGTRADVSFTLFLSDPGTYSGGELVVSDDIGEERFKLNPGEIIVYPSNTLHRVEPVTEGTRLVVIGWVTSWVRDPARRAILFDLWRALNAAEASGDTVQMQLLSKSRSNLIRMWAE